MPSGDALKGKGPGVLWLRAHLHHSGDECLIWPYSRGIHGYGACGYLGKLTGAHRLMCRLVNGEPPTPEHHAAHSCNNGHLGCVHPQHLSWEMPSANRKGANSRRRGQHTREKLTFIQVQAIRASADSYTDLAKAYDVHPHTIGKIVRGEAWVTPLAIERGS